MFLPCFDHLFINYCQHKEIAQLYFSGKKIEKQRDVCQVLGEGFSGEGITTQPVHHILCQYLPCPLFISIFYLTSENSTGVRVMSNARPPPAPPPALLIGEEYQNQHNQHNQLHHHQQF